MRSKIIVGVVILGLLVIIALAIILIKEKSNYLAKKEIKSTDMDYIVKKKASREKINDLELYELSSKLKENKGDKEKVKQIISDLKKRDNVVIISMNMDESMTPDQKQQICETIQKKIKDQFDKLPEADREKMKKGFNSPQGKKSLQNAIHTYYKTSNAEERKKMAPVATGLLNGLNDIANEK